MRTNLSISILARYNCYQKLFISNYHYQFTRISLEKTQTTLLNNRCYPHFVRQERSIVNTLRKKGTNPNEVISDYQAYDMMHKLTDEERKSLKKALSQYESDQVKSKFQGELASTKWRLRFGRKDVSETLGAVDPTGTYCAMPDDWLQKKLAEATIAPTNRDLSRVLLVNAVPFIGFGFLDNFLMIISGDYIEQSIGMFICISTMAAAALGNTISDVLGLGLAGYVEQLCEFCGLKMPKLTPTQMKMKITQRLASFGRVLGITIGCLLGMVPLLFLNISSTSKPPEKAD